MHYFSSQAFCDAQKFTKRQKFKMVQSNAPCIFTVFIKLYDFIPNKNTL